MVETYCFFENYGPYDSMCTDCQPDSVLNAMQRNFNCVGVAGTPPCVILTHQGKTHMRSSYLLATDSSNSLQYWVFAFQCGTNFV